MRNDNRMQGKIIKGIAGFYYVHANAKLYECKAKGIFRKEQQKPLVGDDVLIEIIDEKERKGNIVTLLQRKNEMIRPAVANVDQALVIFSMVKPEPNYNLLDRFLIMMESQGLPCILCFNKRDIALEDKREVLRKTYEACGCHVLFVSALQNEGKEELWKLLAGKTTALAGPSGVGKSSVINWLHPEADMETGDISKKIERGKHTTRHSEIIALSEQTYLIDTPGFTAMKLPKFEKETLKECYPEFEPYEPSCRFLGCVHINEPGCGVKEAVNDGRISSVRYENYKTLYEELKEQKKY